MFSQKISYTVTFSIVVFIDKSANDLFQLLSKVVKGDISHAISGTDQLVKKLTEKSH